MPIFIKNNFGKFLLILVLGIVFAGCFSFFRHLSAEAQEQIKILPESFAGDWLNPQAVFFHDLGPEAEFGDFNIENSASLAEPVCQPGSNRSCGTEVGACQVGVQICQQGVWGECIGAKMPSLELCDSIDNDCDGQVDEGGVCQEIQPLESTSTDQIATSTEEISTTTEEIIISTSTDAVEGQTTTTEEIATSTEETILPSEETTTTDSTTTTKINKPSFLTRLWTKFKNLLRPEARAESLSCQSGSNRSCGTEVGACQVGVQICEQGVWGECIGAKMPSSEICDSVDNDCDGQVDEGICQRIEPLIEELNEVATLQPGRVLILSDFSILPPENSKIKIAQLRLSLAAKGKIGEKLIIDYFYQDSWQNLAVLNLESEISNNLNGGYFLYGLPIFENWQDLENLKIRFTYQNSQSLSLGLQEVYLDAVWLEVDFLREKEFSETIKDMLIFNLYQQKEEIKIYKEDMGFSFDITEDFSKVLTNQIKIGWGVEFEWQGEKLVLREENFNWTWERSQNSLIGKTEIESCPVSLEYFLEDNRLKVRVCAANKTIYPIEDLTYKFIIKYPPDFSLDDKGFILNKGEESIKFTPDLDAIGKSLTKLFDGVYHSAAELSMEVGTVKPGEYFEIEIDLFAE